MPPIVDTSYLHDVGTDSHDQIMANNDNNDNNNLTTLSSVSVSKIKLKSPKYGMHPPQHPTEIQKQKQHQQPYVARTCSTATSSMTSQEFSSHTRSGHSKNSRTTSCNSDNSSKIVVSSFSTLATQSIGQGKYQQALEYYQLALQDYTKDATKTTVVELVNAAATCFNLGALAKKLHEYNQAAQYFTQAQHMYLQSGTLVESYVRSGSTGLVSPLGGPVSSSAASSISSSSVSSYACQVCLLQLIAETLQARAHLHYKYQSQVGDAVECHEEVIELLEESSTNNISHSHGRGHGHVQSSSLEYDTVYHKIHFTLLSRNVRWQLLVTSLQALGKFYVEKGELEDAIVAYQDTLSLLKKLNDFQIESTGQRQEEILQILRALSDIFMQTNLESTDVRKMERAAFLQEDLENWEKAMQCWERVLYCESKEHGDDSSEVSTALAQLARVMVLEGNLEGALDLYQATANISLKNQHQNQKNSNNNINSIETEGSVIFSIPDDIFSSILDLYNELDRIPDAIDWLKSLLSKSERREDQARIQLELGKLHLHQGFIHAASDSLYLSLELFDGEDESAFELLKKVEFLEKRGDDDNVDDEREEELEVVDAIDTVTTNASTDIANDGDVGISCLTAITEDGESAFLREDTSALASSLGAALSNDDDNLVDADDDSVDLSKMMVDDDDDDDLQRTGTNTDNSPCKMQNALTSDIDPDQISRELKKEEEIPQTSGDELMKEKQIVLLRKHPSSENILISAADESMSSIDGSPRKTTNAQHIDKNELYSKRVEIPDINWIPDINYIPDINSDDSSSSNRPESTGSVRKDRDDIEILNSEPEPEPEHQPNISSNSTPTTDADNEAAEVVFAQQNITNFLFQESPITQNETSGLHGTPTTMISANSRTALLNPAGKPGTAQTSLNLPNIAISPKNTNQKTTRGRKGYTEIKKSVKQSRTTGRKRIVKALSSPFRRSRSKSRSATSNPLVALDEEKEVRQSMPMKKPQQVLPDEESYNSKEAPVSYIDMRSGSDDDRSLVSQLTFREYESLSKKKEKENENGHWWWGVTAEGLEGWFPSNYVNQAVEAAEGFLSAKAIHDRVKSRPLDFDSDEESEEVEEDFSLLKDSSSKLSKNQGATNEAAKNITMKSLDLTPQSRKTSFGSSAVKELNESNSESSKMQCLESRIQEKELELEDVRRKNGAEDISVATVLFDLAGLYSKKKDSADAMLYCRQALRIQKSTLNLPQACKSLSFMAEVHSREKRYKEALSCYSEDRRILEAIHGYFDEEIAKNLNQCGHVLARQGEFDLAMDKHKEALRILKECCGENVKNPLVSQTLIQIGAVYYKERNSLANIQSKQNDGYTTFIEGGMLEVIGRAHEARGSYRMAIAFFEEKLQFLNDGENSKDLEDVAETLNSLGMLSCRAGMYLEAIDYYDRALGIQMKLGCDDVQLAMARVLAGSVQFSLGHFSKALKLFQDALDTLRQVGLEQETVAATLFHIGAVHAALCNYDDAMSNLQDALDIQTKLLGTEHPTTFRTRREIGNLYAVYESEVEAAFEEYNDIIEAQRRVHGEKHPYVAETLHSIGCAQARKGNLSDALRTLEDCYNMRLQFLGMDHPQQATTLHEIAKIQLKRGRLKKAIHIIDAALNIRVESLSEHHIDVALAMTTKASCLVARGNFADANKLFVEALPIAKAAIGDLHPSVAWIQVQIGVMHLRKCDFEEASEAVKEAITIYRQSDLDEDHPGIKEAIEELERVERAEMLCV